MRLALFLCACATLPGTDTSFLEELAFSTAQEHLLVLAPDGLWSLRLSGHERRQLIDDRGCAVAGTAGSRSFIRCGANVYAVEPDRVLEFRQPLPALTHDDSRAGGCTSGAPRCACGGGWSPHVDGNRLLWAHDDGDSRTLVRAAGIQSPFVSEDCEVVGFHAAGAVYLVHVRTGRMGLLARGTTLRWPVSRR
jgi:hypothetical protein